jgi:multimeric flavodoxin WrbA
MKIAAILGSPHGAKGATGTLLAELARGARQAGAEVDVLSLTDHKVVPCVACDACHKTGVCPQKDDFHTIASAMTAADGIVLASPNYIVSVSAQMKAVFDRCCGLLHCQALAGRYAAAMETSGGTGGQEVQEYILRFERSLGCWTTGGVGATAADLADPARRQEAFTAAANLGRTLVEAIRQRRTFPQQETQRSAFRERMKALVLFRKDEWPYEYQHWKSKGWL